MKNVVVIDLETTGLSPEAGHRIIEIGAIKLKGERIVGVFDTLVNPRGPIPKRVTEITGIDDSMVASAPGAVDVLPDLIKFVGNDPLVMHNAAFDGKFLREEFMKSGRKKNFSTFCTLKSARATLKNVPNYKLQTLKEHFRLREVGSEHRALADSFVTLQLYLILQGRFREELQETLFKEVTELKELISPPKPYAISRNS